MYYVEKLQGNEQERERQKKVYLKLHYNMTIEEYRCMVAQQNELCAICGQPPKKGSVLHIDHCHKTGVVRELLCTYCNSTIGHAHDNPDILRKAAVYLEKHDPKR